MISSPYPFFHSLSREIAQMQTDYRNHAPNDVDCMKAAVQGLRQEYVPVLTDGAFANQLAIVRGHGHEGYMTVVLDANAESLCFYSRFSIPVLSPDYMEKPDQFWSFVLHVGNSIREVGKTPVLTVGDSDWLLDSMLDFGLKKLTRVFAMNQDYEIQHRLQDKYLQCQLAREAGLPVPGTWIADDAFFEDKLELPFPVLVKERKGKNIFRDTGKQAFEANSWTELLEIRDQLKDYPDLLVQEKISDKGKEDIYSVGAFTGKKHKVEGLFSSRRLRSTRHFGSTAISISTPCEEGVRFSKKFLEYVNYHGSCELEFIYDSQREQLLFMELNNRLYKTQSLATHCGMNFNYMALLDAMERPMPRTPMQIYGPRWWLAWADLGASIRKMNSGEIDFRELMEPLSFDFVNGIDDLDDPLPGFVNLFNGKY